MSYYISPNYCHKYSISQNNVADNKEKPRTEKSTSESETETSKQDTETSKQDTETSKQDTETSKQDSSRDDDVTQHRETIAEIDNTQQPVDDNIKTERPSRSRNRAGSKALHRDSIQVTQLRNSQDVRRISSRNKSVSREPQRNSSKLEKSRSSSEEKTDSTKKQCSVKSVLEHEYLQFSLRITEDIIRNDLYNNDEMKRVFNSHIEANRGRLDMNKMKEQIKDLCKELNITYDDNIDRSSCREDVGKVQENLKNIICFSSPQKQLCIPCDGQLTSQVRMDDIQLPEKKSSSVLPELKAPSQTIDMSTPSVTGEKELTSARNKTKTPPLQTIAESAPPTGRKLPRSASPHKNKTATPTKALSLQADESTPPVEKQSRIASPGRKKPATPTKAGSRAMTVPKLKQSFAIGESDIVKPAVDEDDKTKSQDNNILSEASDDAMKSSEQIEESTPNEFNIFETDSDIPVGQVPETICSVCCVGKPVCLPFCQENLQPTSPETRLPSASLGDDARFKSNFEEVKPNLIFVGPPISSEKKDFSMMVKQLQKHQTTQGPKIKTDYPKANQTESIKPNEDKAMQKDALTGIPALDNTLRNYNLEMLAQNSSCPPSYECHTQMEPSYNALQETYKYKCKDFMPSQKATDEFVVVSGPIYIPTHVIEPNSSCNCNRTPLSSFLKPLPSTCVGETCKSLRMKKDLQQINLLLTDNYNSRNHPDISMFYPTVSTQTSSSDFAVVSNRASANKSTSLLLETPPILVSIDSLNKMKFDPTESAELNKTKLSPKKDEKEEEQPSEVDSQLSELIDTLKEKQRLRKELRMKDMIVIDEEDVEKTEQDSGTVDVETEESSEMFIAEAKSSKEESDHLKHKVNQIIDMRGNDNGSETSVASINNGRVTLKSSSSDAVDKTPQVLKQVKEEKRKKKDSVNLDATEFMKKLDHKPNMSMTNSMANSIKKQVNRESQQFRSPDDKRITWGNRRLKIKKLTDSDNEINVIQEEEEQDSADRHSIKSDNNKID